MTQTVVKSVDEIPRVCLEDDLMAIFRLSRRDIRLWRRFPEFVPFPPLPELDRHLRVSGCVVAWFLAQEARNYYRTFEEPLRDQLKGMRGRSRPPWWKLGPPHAERYWARPLEGEKATLGVDALAEILRTTAAAVRRAAKAPGFPMPPASARPLRWTPGQIERLLWAPQDHEEHLQAMRPANRRRR